MSKSVSSMHYVVGIFFSLIVNCVTSVAYGQSYPTKPIRLLVGFPPGGGVDVLARQITPKLGEQLGQQIIVENRSGAGTNIASELLANAPPNGYVLMLSTSSITINPSLYKKVAFDPVRDFAPIMTVAVTPFILVIHPSLPVNSLRDLIALAKAKPGQLSYSSAGNGSVGHLASELLKRMTATNILHVPFRGNPPAMIALLEGEVQFAFGTLPATLPHVRAGRLRMLAVSSARRSPFIPELSTVSEAGISGYDVTQWYGLLAPAQTPTTIIAKLNGELMKVLDMQEIRARLASQSLEIRTSTPQQFSDFIKSELLKWAKVVREGNIRVD